MAKAIVYSEDARRDIQRGVNELAALVHVDGWARSGLENQQRRAAADLVAAVQRHRLGNSHPIEEGSVGRTEVLEHPSPLLCPKSRMAARDRPVVQWSRFAFAADDGLVVAQRKRPALVGALYDLYCSHEPTSRTTPSLEYVLRQFSQLAFVGRLDDIAHLTAAFPVSDKMLR